MDDSSLFGRGCAHRVKKSSPKAVKAEYYLTVPSQTQVADAGGRVHINGLDADLLVDEVYRRTTIA